MIDDYYKTNTLITKDEKNGDVLYAKLPGMPIVIIESNKDEEILLNINYFDAESSSDAFFRRIKQMLLTSKMEAKKDEVFSFIAETLDRELPVEQQAKMLKDYLTELAISDICQK